MTPDKIERNFRVGAVKFDTGTVKLTQALCDEDYRKGLEDAARIAEAEVLPEFKRCQQVCDAIAAAIRAKKDRG